MPLHGALGVGGGSRASPVTLWRHQGCDCLGRFRLDLLPLITGRRSQVIHGGAHLPLDSGEGVALPSDPLPAQETAGSSGLRRPTQISPHALLHTGPLGWLFCAIHIQGRFFPTAVYVFPGPV